MLRRSTGFTLVELLVGMAIGLIVAGGAMAMFVSIARSTSTIVQTNRMQQELREIGLVMTRDIRRAGYSGVVPGVDFNGDGEPNNTMANSSAIMDAVRTDLLFNPHLSSSADIRIYDAAGTDDCILFSYNIDGDLPAANTAAAVENDEWFGYRRQVVNGRGVLQMKTAGASPADCSTGTWVPISSNEFDVTALTFAMTTAEIEIDNLSGGTAGTCEANDACQCIRTVDVDLAVRLVGNNDVSTVMSDSVRVRNDKIAQVRSGNTHCHD